MSQLTTIFSALAATTITVGITSITALNGATLPDSVESAQLPIRLILPVGGKASGTVATPRTFKTSATEGGVLVVDWTISDLLLWRALGAGIGLTDLAPDLIAYMAAYMAVVAPLRTSRWSLTGITFPVIGGLEWPASSDRWYSGVQASLTIREII